MKKFLMATALVLPFSVFAQATELSEEVLMEEGNYLIDYDGQDDKEKKLIRHNPVLVKYIEGSEDLDFYRPRNIEGASKQLAEEARRNHWAGRYIYNMDDPNPNEIRPEEDPLINSGENAENKMLIPKKRDWLYYDVEVPGEYFQYRLSPKLRLQDSFWLTRFGDRYRKSLLQEKRKKVLPESKRYMRENENYIDYTGDYNRLDGERSGQNKLAKLYGIY
jgi:hypothetical protein